MSHLYKPHLTPLAREQRNGSTKGEVLLWMRLRAKALGVGFQRQKPLGNYIADFYAPALRLVIEVDGVSHTFDEAQQRDIRKDQYLQSIGIEVIRIDDHDIFCNIEQVVTAIKAKVDEIEEKRNTEQSSHMPTPRSLVPP